MVAVVLPQPLKLEMAILNDFESGCTQLIFPIFQKPLVCRLDPLAQRNLWLPTQFCEAGQGKKRARGFLRLGFFSLMRSPKNNHIRYDLSPFPHSISLAPP